MKPTILAHVCCAPDAVYAIGILQQDYDVTGVFFNPNIWPPEEYGRRLEEARKVEDVRVLRQGLGYCWSVAVAGSPDLGLPAFTTVMSVSPLKKADVINRIGSRLARKHGLAFLEADFKKKGGFQKSVELSRRHALYRQNYCGCLYSRKDDRT